MKIVPSLAAPALALALLAPAGPAAAITFTEPAHFNFSGNIGFLTEPLLTDTAVGFVLQGDYRVGEGTSFLVASRPFSIGPLPERIESAAHENYKLVLAGGGSGQASTGWISAQVYYRILPAPQGANLPAAATIGPVLLADNALGVQDAGTSNLLDGVLPSSRILGSGDYILQTFIELNADFDAAAVYPQMGFIELGGLTPFGGVSVELIGIPVPEPTPAALLAGGLALVAWWRRRCGPTAARPR